MERGSEERSTAQVAARTEHHTLCVKNRPFGCKSTRFQKPDHKLVSWRHKSTKPDSPLRRSTVDLTGSYDTLDYWLVDNRWKNSCMDCETSMTANIDTDHPPLIMTTRLKLKAQSTTHNNEPQWLRIDNGGRGVGDFEVLNVPASTTYTECKDIVLDHAVARIDLRFA